MTSAGPIDPRLWKYSRSARAYLVLTVVASLITTAAVIVSAIMIGTVLAGVITDPASRSIGHWSPQLSILAAAVVVRTVATWWSSRYAHRSASRVIEELENKVVDAATTMDTRTALAERDSVAQIVTRGLGGLTNYLTGYVPALILSMIVTPLVVLVILLNDVTSAVIIAVTLPLIPIFMILIGLLTQGQAAQTLTTTTRLSSQLLDLIAGLPTLRALGRERGMAARVRALGDDNRRITMRALRTAFLSSMVLELLATLCVALVAVSIGLRLVFGDMTLQAGLIALILAPEVYIPLRAVGTAFHAAQDGKTASERAFGILDAAGPGTAGVVRIDARGADIVLDSLSVAGRGGFAPADLTSVLRSGVVNVLTGPNGSGKSTALQAILGLATIAGGRVTINDVEVSNLDLDHWWTQVTWLPQRPVLIPGTLADNLDLAGPRRATSLELDNACRRTGFDAVLAGLPDGWNTVVGNRGITLSLGERQRLALTRTLVSSAPVVLLDEPTAHLDDAAEAVVLQAIADLAHAGRTVVVVAHRPSVLAIADRVFAVKGKSLVAL